jgi:cytochrome c
MILSFLALCLSSVAPARADDRLWANCRTCHAVTAPDGRVLARGGRSGPNLFGLAGRAVAGDAGFKLYSPDLQALRATGRRWSEGDFVAYLANPDQFLQSATGNPGARSDMHVQMRQGGPALWAWLAALR